MQHFRNATSGRFSLIGVATNCRIKMPFATAFL